MESILKFIREGGVDHTMALHRALKIVMQKKALPSTRPDTRDESITLP